MFHYVPLPRLITRLYQALTVKIAKLWPVSCLMLGNSGSMYNDVYHFCTTSLLIVRERPAGADDGLSIAQLFEQANDLVPLSQ